MIGTQKQADTRCFKKQIRPFRFNFTNLKLFCNALVSSYLLSIKNLEIYLDSKLHFHESVDYFCRKLACFCRKGHYYG